MGPSEGWYCPQCGDGPFGSWNPGCSSCEYKSGNEPIYYPLDPDPSTTAENNVKDPLPKDTEKGIAKSPTSQSTEKKVDSPPPPQITTRNFVKESFRVQEHNTEELPQTVTEDLNKDIPLLIPAKDVAQDILPQTTTESIVRHRLPQKTEQDIVVQNLSPQLNKEQIVDGQVEPAPNEDGWVLVVVQSRGDYHLTQIKMQGLSSGEFFRCLRDEYFKLRGFSALYFSVWCFSHFDFHKFDKFDRHAIAPIVPNQYPDPLNKEYRYDVKLVVDIPPISKREFEKRFHSHSFRNTFHVRCHRSCACAIATKGAHNRDIIDLLPKKRSQLDLQSDLRECFWGLFARQKISFWRIAAYNLMCVGPLVWFFFMWLFAWDHEGDVQSASVPLMITLTLLSVFWTVFISSAREGSSEL